MLRISIGFRLQASQLELSGHGCQEGQPYMDNVMIGLCGSLIINEYQSRKNLLNANNKEKILGRFTSITGEKT